MALELDEPLSQHDERPIGGATRRGNARAAPPPLSLSLIIMTQHRLSCPLQPLPARPSAHLTPRDRLTLWWALLAALSLQDVAYTLTALHGVPGARELNPLPALALEHSLVVALALKGIALLVVLLACWAIAKSRHWPGAERILAVWCVLYLVLNAYSAIRLLGGI